MLRRIFGKSKGGLKTETIKLKGSFHFVHRDKEGRIKDVRDIKNLIVNAGKAAVAGLILTDVSVSDFDQIAIGTGTTAPAAGDTALETETHRSAGTGSRVTTSVTDDTAQLVVTFNFSGSYAITEAGVFNAGSGGDMLCRQTFSAINVANGDSLEITYKVQVS